MQSESPQRITQVPFVEYIELLQARDDVTALRAELEKAARRESIALEAAQKLADESEKRKERLNELLVEVGELKHKSASREAVMILALRNLVNALPANQRAALIYFAGTPLARATDEAVELLRIVDSQK